MWFQAFIAQYQESIIKRIIDNARKSSEFNPNNDVYKNGQKYFQLFVDIDIPIKEHPEFQRIPELNTSFFSCTNSWVHYIVFVNCTLSFNGYRKLHRCEYRSNSKIFL